MLDPIYQDITCPKCRKREVYLDREIGFYCMLCGEQFSAEQILLFIKILQMGQATGRKLLDGECGLPKELPIDYVKSDGHRDQTTAIREIPEQKKASADREVARQGSR